MDAGGLGVLRRFVPVLVLAFVVGSLFRLGNVLGMPVLRMFGTQGIVVIGLMLAWNIKRLQIEDGLRRLDESLKSLPSRVKVQPLTGAGKMPLWLVESEGRRILLGGSDIAQSMGKRRARSALERHAASLLKAAESHGLTRDGRELTPALVLLRRRASESDQIRAGSFPRPVVLVNPEGVDRLVSGG